MSIIYPSFLHRLQDDHPWDEERSVTPTYRRPEVVKTLISDLSMLFSSRPLSIATPLFGELPKSVLNYGVFDVVEVDITDDERIEVLKKNIQQALEYFEPRLNLVSITLQKNTPENILFWVKGKFFNELIVFSILWSSTAYTYSISQDR